jgi:hypothetical protein
MLKTAVALLKGDSLTSYEAAMEDNHTNLDDKSLMVPMTERHIDNALLAVTNQIFPYRALETQNPSLDEQVLKEALQNGSQAVCYLDEQD